MEKLPYYCNCTSWPNKDVHAEGGLCDMIAEAIDIERRTFLRHVNRDDLKMLESNFGYDDHPKKGLTMAGDYHVSYHRSKLHGKVVYYFRYSSIEYVFHNFHEDPNARR